MKRNNRGFTLIELIVAVAILGIVAAGAFGFMVSGANSYRSIFSGVSLQYASQQAMNQIQETVIDCNTAVYVPPAGDEVYLLSVDDAGIYTVRSYVFSVGAVDYRQTEVTSGSETTTVTDSDPHLLTNDVTAFSADVKEKSGKAVSVTITVTLTRQDKTYTGTQDIALRNTPVVVPSLEKLLNACV